MNQQQLKQLLSDIKKQPSNDKKWEILTKLLEETIGKIMTINNTFAYAMQVRHAKQIAEQKRTTKNLQMQSANLNQRTSTTPTGLFGANLNDTINKNIGRSFKAMQNRKGLEKALNDRFARTIADYTDNELLAFAKDTI